MLELILQNTNVRNTIQVLRTTHGGREMKNKTSGRRYEEYQGVDSRLRWSLRFYVALLDVWGVTHG